MYYNLTVFRGVLNLRSIYKSKIKNPQILPTLQYLSVHQSNQYSICSMSGRAKVPFPAESKQRFKIGSCSSLVYCSISKGSSTQKLVNLLQEYCDQAEYHICTCCMISQWGKTSYHNPWYNQSLSLYDLKSVKGDVKLNKLANRCATILLQIFLYVYTIWYNLYCQESPQSLLEKNGRF